MAMLKKEESFCIERAMSEEADAFAYAKELHDFYLLEKKKDAQTAFWFYRMAECSQNSTAPFFVRYFGEPRIKFYGLEFEEDGEYYVVHLKINTGCSEDCAYCDMEHISLMEECPGVIVEHDTIRVKKEACGWNELKLIRLRVKCKCCGNPPCGFWWKEEPAIFAFRPVDLDAYHMGRFVYPKSVFFVQKDSDWENIPTERKHCIIKDGVTCIPPIERPAWFSSLHISKTVTQIDRTALGTLCDAAQITIDEANPTFMIEDEILFSIDKKILYYHMPCPGMEVCSSPDTVEEICDGAFAEIDSIREIVLPKGLKRIGNYAFEGFEGNEVEFPDCLEYIGAYAFGEAPDFKNIVIAEKTELAEDAFGLCSTAILRK